MLLYSEPTVLEPREVNISIAILLTIEPMKHDIIAAFIELTYNNFSPIITDAI